MAAETFRASLNRYPVTVGVVLAICIGLALGQIQDLSTASDIASVIATSAVFVYLLGGKHKVIASFALSVYLLWWTASIDAYAVSILLDLAVCGLFITLWRNEHALQRTKETDPKAQARAKETSPIGA